MSIQTSAYRSFEIHMAVNLEVCTQKFQDILQPPCPGPDSSKEGRINLGDFVYFHLCREQVFFGYAERIKQFPVIVQTLNKAFKQTAREFGFVAISSNEQAAKAPGRLVFRGIFSTLLQEGRRFAGTRL